MRLLHKYKQQPNRMWVLFYRFDNSSFISWSGSLKSGAYPYISHKCDIIQQDILSNQEFRSGSTVTLIKSLSTVVESFSKHFSDVHQIALISFEVDSMMVQENTCEAYIFPPATPKIALLRTMENYAEIEN